MTLRNDLFFIREGDTWALCHYIIYRISTHNLPYETKDGQTVYTDEGMKAFCRFITECVDTFNEIHEGKLDAEEVADLVVALRRRDRSEAERIGNIPP
jgi:hypothetical protein